MNQQIILVTGASTGFGRLTAEALAAAGHIVYAGMRGLDGRNADHAAELEQQARAKGQDLHAVELDVLSQASADAALKHVVDRHGRIDVVVHNAGHLVIGPTEAFSPEEIAQVFDTNVLGTQRVNRAALPYMRQREHGLLLWVGSSTTRGGYPPFIGPYAAAKAAMDSLAVSLSYELARFGIETAIVVPGAFPSGTNHFSGAGKPADAQRNAAYARYDGLMDRVTARLAELMPPHADPRAVADEIVRVVELPHGTRPARSVIDFANDGAEEVMVLGEKVRIDFAERIGIADLLHPTK